MMERDGDIKGEQKWMKLCSCSEKHNQIQCGVSCYDLNWQAVESAAAFVACSCLSSDKSVVQVQVAFDGRFSVNLQIFNLLSTVGNKFYTFGEEVF